MPQDRLDELNAMIGRMLEERAQDHEAYLREREAVALLVVGIERHCDALQNLVSQAKTRLVGISPSGRPAA